MGRNKQVGFTIIEVMLFLGISALMLMIALYGTNTTLRSMRFSDGANSFHAYIQKQYDDVLNGVNPPGTGTGVIASPPAGTCSSGCVLLGKVLHFSGPGSSLVTTYPVIGTIPGSVTGIESDEELIYKYKPYVTNQGGQRYEMAWGTKFKLAERANNGSSPKTILSLAFLRSPKSSRVITYVYNRPGEPSPTYDLTDHVSPTNPLYSFNNIARAGITNICLESNNGSGPGAKIVILPNSQGAEGIKLLSEPSAGDCDGF